MVAHNKYLLVFGGKAAKPIQKTKFCVLDTQNWTWFVVRTSEEDRWFHTAITEGQYMFLVGGSSSSRSCMEDIRCIFIESALPGMF